MKILLDSNVILDIALSSNLKVIITRNKKDFKPATKIEILTPQEFVKKYLQQ